MMFAMSNVKVDISFQDPLPAEIDNKDLEESLCVVYTCFALSLWH